MICLCVVEVCIEAEGQCCGDCTRPYPSAGPDEAAFTEGECAPPPGCGCLCHSKSGMAVQHIAPCCAGPDTTEGGA